MNNIELTLELTAPSLPVPGPGLRPQEGAFLPQSDACIEENDKATSIYYTPTADTLPIITLCYEVKDFGDVQM